MGCQLLVTPTEISRLIYSIRKRIENREVFLGGKEGFAKAVEEYKKGIHISNFRGEDGVECQLQPWVESALYLLGQAFDLNDSQLGLRDGTISPRLLEAVLLPLYECLGHVL